MPISTPKSYSSNARNPSGSSLGVTWRGPSVGPFTGGGGGGRRDDDRSNIKKQAPAVFKDQIFEVECTGMKPNTVHKFYYEGVERGQDCIPVYPKPTSSVTVKGSPLKTDSDGKINFKFYFTQDVEKQVDASNKVKFELAGDKKFELRATDSSAYKIVPFTNFKK